MSNFNNVPIPEELRELHATVEVAFEKAKSAAEADVRSIYESKKRKTAQRSPKDGLQGHIAHRCHVVKKQRWGDFGNKPKDHG